MVTLSLWLFSLGLIATILYSPYTYVDRPRLMTVPESVAWNALHRAGWALALAVIVLLCSTDNGGEWQIPCA